MAASRPVTLTPVTLLRDSTLSHLPAEAGREREGVTHHEALMQPEQLVFARKLRKHQTSAEEILWQGLRGRRLGGHKFRRQFALGPYVLDFICVDARLVVEVDGKQHDEECLYDARRTADIEAQGLVVIRFTNRQVRERPDDVLAAILAALRRE